MSSHVLNTTLSRKVHRIAVGVIFFLQGLCFASWGSRIPNIQQKLGLSEVALGMVLFALPAGQMLSLPFSGWVIAKAGSRKVVTVAVLLYALILVTLGMAATRLELITGLFLFGLAGNIVNISINTQAVGVEVLYQRSIMASFHGLWSLAAFTGAAVGTLMIGEGILPQQHFMFIAVVVVLVGIAGFRFILPEDIDGNKNQPVFVMPDKSLLNLGLIAFCSLICEGAMFDWSGVYFKKVVQVEKAWVGLGYTAFMFTMASGRFVADWFTSRFGMKAILQCSGLLTASGLLLAVAFPNVVTATIGFLLVGAGVSSVVPLVYSAAGRTKVMSAGAALAAVSTIGFMGFLLGPPVIGLVAGATSLRVSYCIIAFMGLCVTVVASKSKSM